MTFGQGAPEGIPLCGMLQPQPLAGRSRCAQFWEPVSVKAPPPHLAEYSSLVKGQPTMGNG